MKGKIPPPLPPQEGKEGERERKGLYFFEPNLNLLRKFHNNQDLCKYCQYMRTCLKNYSYSYIYIFGNFPSGPCHMLYLPLGFWGLQVNLQTQEQKSVHTAEMSADTPKAPFTDRPLPQGRWRAAATWRQERPALVLRLQLWLSDVCRTDWPRAQTTRPGLDLTPEPTQPAPSGGAGMRP